MEVSKNIENKLSDQDFKQKTNAFIIVLIEIYKVLAASLLILFVPQKCDDHVCSYEENFESDSNTYTGGLVINFLTLALFMVLYGIEIKRENRLITYLEVNIAKPSDNVSVGNALNHLPLEKKQAILSLDKIYNKLGKCSIVLFVANSILSGLIVYNYYLDSQTTTTFITNIFFMSGKIYDVYVNVNTEENVFYSAYLKTKVQYNDVDPNKMIEMSNVEGNEETHTEEQERILEESKNDQIEVASVNNI
jgi:hypothetical protein